MGEGPNLRGLDRGDSLLQGRLRRGGVKHPLSCPSRGSGAPRRRGAPRRSGSGHAPRRLRLEDVRADDVLVLDAHGAHRHGRVADVVEAAL